MFVYRLLNSARTFLLVYRSTYTFIHNSQTSKLGPLNLTPVSGSLRGIVVERPGGKLLGLARVVERGRVEKITEQNPELLFGGDGGSWGEWRERSGCP